MKCLVQEMACPLYAGGNRYSLVDKISDLWLFFLLWQYDNFLPLYFEMRTGGFKYF